MTPVAHPHPQRIPILAVTTLAFTVTFAVWMMMGVIGIPIKQQLGLNETQFGLLTALPVLTGAVIRLPMGIWTDRFGGRTVMLLLLLASVAPVYLISHATQFWHFLALGLVLGMVGGVFSVGVPYVGHFFTAEHRGFAMGIFGAGTTGAALNMFVAPVIISAWGWQKVPQVYALAILVTAAIFWFVSVPDPGAHPERRVPFLAQVKVLRDPRVWKYCQYYSIVFGGFTGLSLWMTLYYVQEYGLDLQHAALLAVCFALPAGLLRAAGGWLSDRFGAHSVTWWVLWVAWVCLFLLSYPQTELTVHTVTGPRVFAIAINPLVFTALLFIVGAAFAFGMASVFKYVAVEFPDNLGIVSGIVGMAGGLAGFLLPIMFGALVDLIGVRSSAFMLLYGVTWVSLILIYITEVRRSEFLVPGIKRVVAD
ncbi:MAG: NarK/NasA family nitrate transporter [Burkholderiales bacterium]|nr:NarK/NasA family nitrate transporter [Burkholderiales bacterium]